MSLTILTKIKTATGDHELQLPMSQNEFDEALTKAGVLKCAAGEYEILSAISDTLDYGEIEWQAADIEELNFLAQRFDSYSESETETFLALVEAHGSVMPVRELINLAYNLNNYNIERTIHDISEIGEAYVNHHAPDLDPLICESINFDNLGDEVQKEDRGVFTDVGYCSNFNDDVPQIYDGKFLPDSDYETGYSLKIRLSSVENNETQLFDNDLSDTKGVYIILPASENVFNRAMERLGVNSLSDCVVTEYDSWHYDRLKNMFAPDEDIRKLNHLAETLGNIPQTKTEKFNTALNNNWYTEGIDGLLKYIDDFIEASFQQQLKPNCRLIGENGNIYNLMGIAAKTPKESSMPEQATEMCGRIINSGSYAEALNIIGEYVNITGPEQEQAAEQKTNIYPGMEMQ